MSADINHAYMSCFRRIHYNYWHSANARVLVLGWGGGGDGWCWRAGGCGVCGM